MKSPQSGFTLLELVTVIVIVGVLAAVATSKYVAIRNDTTQAALKGLAMQLGAAMEFNKNARLVNATHGLTINNCSQADVLLSGGLPAGYTLAAFPLTTPFHAGICTISVVPPDTQTATFVGYGIS